ncbi:unnamed protein product, partial [marine sediment metagenome]
MSSLLLTCTEDNGTIFYVNSSRGSDSNSGLTPDRAWTTLSKVNSTIFKPGDKILLHSGSEYFGQLKPSGSGKENNPIIIDIYGGEEKPKIHGEGKYQSAVLLENVEYWEVNNIEITNTGKSREPHRQGVIIHINNFGDCHHIYLNNLKIRDVNGSLVKSEGGGGAINWHNEGDSLPSRFIDLRIENCHISRCGRNAITSWGYTNRKNWHPSLEVQIRNNIIEEVPGDGIVPIGCEGAIIEHNVMRNSPDILSHKEAAAGIWPWSSDNTIIQYNEVYNHNAKWDGQG